MNRCTPKSGGKGGKEEETKHRLPAKKQIGGPLIISTRTRGGRGVRKEQKVKKIRPRTEENNIT